MEKTETTIVRLCLKQKYNFDTMKTLEELGIEFAAFRMDIMSEILDLLGVPQDGARSVLSRDWLKGVFKNTPIDKIHLYPDFVKTEMLKYGVK